MKLRPRGKELFAIGIIADTHVNEAEDFSASPYPANALANARARAVFREVEAMAPAFTVHLGDMVNPVPELPTYREAVSRFREIAALHTGPLHLVPGNHDIGDKPVDWMPAGQVDAASLALYREAFGPDHYGFEHEGVLFLVVNASIINSGLPAEAEQMAWLEGAFEAGRGKRCFVFIHYPPFTTSEDESGSYDNIDEPGRSWFLDLIRTYRPEAVLAAHVHNPWYNRVGDTELYTLPSTCFVRHDYSEMYRVPPGDQNGRNDVAKLGYGRLAIHEEGHVLDVFRSYGRMADDALPPWRGPPVHSRRVAFDRFGLDMRQPWAEVVEVTPSGAVDEFERKKARNDYPLQAMWEMGLRRMRVPVQDLADAAIRERIAILRDIGHVIHVHSYGLPKGAAAVACEAHGDLVDLLEVVVDWRGADTDLSALADFGARTGIALALSRVNRKDTTKFSGGRYNHLISHGFTFEEADELREALAPSGDGSAIAGVMVAVSRAQAPLAAVRAAARLAADIGKDVCLYLKTTSASPAEDFTDDVANTARVVEALFAVAAVRSVTVIADTFADIDRGYFVRTGLVDRRFNPKLGSRAVARLIGLLAGRDWAFAPSAGDADTVAEIAAGDGTRLALLVASDGAPQVRRIASDGAVDVIDLASAG